MSETVDEVGAGTETPAPPTHVSDIERLTVANLALTSRVLLNDRKELIVQLQKTDIKLAETRDLIRKAQEELAKKYGIDFSKQQIEVDTGRIIPAP
jgi:hypothetical protein